MASFYPYRFVQNFNDSSGHLKSKSLYTFKSYKSNLWYWVWIERYDCNVYAVKFHLKSLKDCEDKYNRMSNTYEPRRIVFTCIHIMLEVYHRDNLASFGFIGSNMLNEGIQNTKRFRFYKKIMATYFSEDSFVHQESMEKSTYLMINKKVLADNPGFMDEIEKAFIEQYDYFE